MLGRDKVAGKDMTTNWAEDAGQEPSASAAVVSRGEHDFGEAVSALRRDMDAAVGRADGGSGGQPGVTWLDVGKKIGPLTVDRIGLSFESPDDVWLWLDAGMSAAGLTLDVEGLGLGVSVSHLTPELALRGLGVDFNRPPVRLAGAFAYFPKADARYQWHFEGAALLSTPVVSAEAMGLYGKIAQPPNLTTMFAFLKVMGKDGKGLGPPQLQITGFSAGFGYNSSLRMPAAEDVWTFPFMQDIKDPDSQQSPLQALEALTSGPTPWVKPQDETYWGSIGLTANSCRLVDISAAAVLEFGPEQWALGLLGLASAKFPPEGPKTFARVELQLAAEYSSATGLLAIGASLTKNSFLIDPGCRLTGGMAFYLWLAGEHHGDFVFTLGGYGPHANEMPAHYPKDIQPIGYTWSVSSVIQASGGVYCALRPSMFIIGGALSVDVRGSFGPASVHAWLKATFDTKIEWNPFHFDLSIRLSIGFRVKVWIFSASGEVHVSLGLWGPSVGGRATVSLPLGAHISIPFGADKQGAPPRPADWKTFADQHLPKDASSRMQLTALGGVEPRQGGQTRGANDSWIVGSHEFSFGFTTPIPLTKITVHTTNLINTGESLNIRPMGKTGLTSHATIDVQDMTAHGPLDLSRWNVKAQNANTPRALWGPAFNASTDSSAAGVLEVPVGALLTVPVPSQPAGYGPYAAKNLRESAPLTGHMPIHGNPAPGGAVPTPGGQGVIGSIASSVSGPARAALNNRLGSDYQVHEEGNGSLYQNEVSRGLFLDYPMAVGPEPS